MHSVPLVKFLLESDHCNRCRVPDNKNCLICEMQTFATLYYRSWSSERGRIFNRCGYSLDALVKVYQTIDKNY